VCGSSGAAFCCRHWSSLLVPGRFEKDESTAIDVAEARRHSQYGQHGNQSRTGELRRRPGRQRVFIARRYRPWRRRRPTVSAFPRLPCFLSSLTISSHFSSRSAFSGPFLSFISSLQFSSPFNFFSVKAQLANGSKCPSVCPSVCLMMQYLQVFTRIRPRLRKYFRRVYSCVFTFSAPLLPVCQRLVGASSGYVGRSYVWPRRHLFMSTITLQYDTIRDAVLTCAQKLK